MIYARKSTEQRGVSDDAKSVTRQTEHARAFATSKGWTVRDGHVYLDDGVSGAEFEKRPGLQAPPSPPPPGRAAGCTTGTGRSSSCSR